MHSKISASSLALLIALPAVFAAEPTATALVATPPAPAPAVFSNSSPILFREGGAGLPPYPVMVREETPPARAARMKWFHDARFGLFIHWGVYAVPAGTWKGKPAGAEWIMNNAKIPITEYKPLAGQFSAAKYDPTAWAALAAEAGVKYVVLTAKHHDGFTLYDSAYSDWNAVKSSAAARDLIQPLADAVRAKGLKFGLYYSQSQDWTNLGGGTGNKSPWDEEQKKGSFDDYLTKIAVPQVREILEKYHPAYLFFDTEYSITPERARPFFDLTCQYPDLIVNNRLGGGFLGDTATPEQKIFTDPLGRQFEVCMTMNRSWGYNATDLRWKSVRDLIRNLSDITSKGGNYLLNVGPTADGTIPEPEVERLKAMGRWLRTNGDAIYGTEAGPYAKSPEWGRVTQRFNRGGGATLYVHVWNWPADGKIVLTGVRVAADAGKMLANGAAVSSVLLPEGLVVTLPGSAPDPDVSVAAIDISEPIQVIATGVRRADTSASGTPLDPGGGIPPK
jgi:alpha-L-fucosidase